MMFKYSKFKNKKIMVDNFVFDSKREANYYMELKLDPDVHLLELQPKFVLQPKFKKNGKTYREIVYIADFHVTYKNGSERIIDVKGHKTREFLLKQKMFEYVFPDKTLELV